ncbi:pyridoxal-phosphate dependent enzyme [Enhygromyxa salina]|uniref:pyridoxal-phosphate dependent enzyme n=1 Tax=Enhygromyxa salina TaxID=215803 RepID=UPI0015E68533|nr:pyridoxal-phosphate dependent enzyme [Enhygromyxa salina]
MSLDQCNARAPDFDQAFAAGVLQTSEVEHALGRLLRSQFGCGAQAQPDRKLRVLDLGGGVGRCRTSLCNTLGNKVRSLTLVDRSEVALERARQGLAAHQPMVRGAQLSELAEGGFDLVIAAYSISQLAHAEKRALFATVTRLLALGGKFILIDVLQLSSFERELADVAEHESRARGWNTELAVGDGALARAPTVRATVERRATVDEHLAWLRQADMEAACVWRGLDTAIFIARARARRGSHGFRPELAPPQCDSVLETIGNTPLVALRRICRDLDGLVVMKLEGFNPGHSKQDRVAVEMIRAARRSEALRPGQTIVEITSGATGAGLAISCCVLGHPFVAVMSRGHASAHAHAQMMRSCGAQVVLVDQDPASVPGQVCSRDLALVEARAQSLVREHGYFRVDSFKLRANVRAHEQGTAQELLRQSDAPIDGFVDLVGSGGTFTGIARALKAAQPGTVCMAIEPPGPPALDRANITELRHCIRGGGSRARSSFDPADCDGLLTVTNAEAIACAQELARVEGIFGGYSTGANLAGALQLLERLGPGAVVACLAADSGASSHTY